MVGAPLARAVAADLTVFRIEGQFPVAVLATALLLTGFGRTRGLLGMERGRLELSLAETATPLVHSFRFQATLSELLSGKLSTGKEQAPSRPPLLRSATQD
jgi:hypothetical protein